MQLHDNNMEWNVLLLNLLQTIYIYVYVCSKLHNISTNWAVWNLSCGQRQDERNHGSTQELVKGLRASHSRGSPAPAENGSHFFGPLIVDRCKLSNILLVLLSPSVISVSLYPSSTNAGCLWLHMYLLCYLSSTFWWELLLQLVCFINITTHRFFQCWFLAYKKCFDAWMQAIYKEIWAFFLVWWAALQWLFFITDWSNTQYIWFNHLNHGWMNLIIHPLNVNRTESLDYWLC